MLIKDFPISNRPKNALIAAGYESEEDLREKYLEDIKELPNMGNKSILELREFLYSKFKIVLKNRPKPKMDNFKEARMIVAKFLKHCTFVKWGPEIKMASTLIDRYGLETLNKVIPNLKTKTLAFYLCDAGRKYINAFLPAKSVEVEKPVITGWTEPPKPEDLIYFPDPEKVQEQHKPKSLRDFLKR